MATTHISPAVATPDSVQLNAIARQLNATYQELDRLKRVMDTMINGSDYTLLESMYGLTAGQGQTCYNLISGALAQIYNAGSGSAMQLMAWLG